MHSAGDRRLWLAGKPAFPALWLNRCPICDLAFVAPFGQAWHRIFLDPRLTTWRRHYGLTLVTLEEPLLAKMSGIDRRLFLQARLRGAAPLAKVVWEASFEPIADLVATIV